MGESPNRYPNKTMTAQTTGELIIEARNEIWEAINTLKAAGDHGNADALVLEAARCGDHFDWLTLREEAVEMAAAA